MSAWPDPPEYDDAAQDARIEELVQLAEDGGFSDCEEADRWLAEHPHLPCCDFSSVCGANHTPF